VDALVQNFELFIMIGVIAVIAIAQFHRMAGAMVGLVFYIAMAIVGTQVYQAGGQIGIGSWKFGLMEFYGFVLVVAGITVLPVLLKRGRGRPKARVHDPDDL
jgi:hypothetical protein